MLEKREMVARLGEMCMCPFQCGRLEDSLKTLFHQCLNNTILLIAPVAGGVVFILNDSSLCVGSGQ